MYVARVYAHELQKMSLKDLQPVLSQNMNSLLVELAAQEDIKLAHSNSSNRGSFGSSSRGSIGDRSRSYGRPQNSNNSNRKLGGQSSKSCAFCKACKRPYLGHDVNNCWTLSRFNKSDIISALMVDVEDDVDFDDRDG